MPSWSSLTSTNTPLPASSLISPLLLISNPPGPIKFNELIAKSAPFVLSIILKLPFDVIVWPSPYIFNRSLPDYDIGLLINISEVWTLIVCGPFFELASNIAALSVSLPESDELVTL